MLLWTQRNERSRRGLFYLAAWTCVALSVMGKAGVRRVAELCVQNPTSQPLMVLRLRSDRKSVV